MSMRRRLLRSYLVVIFLAFFYIAFSFAMSTFRLQMEKDKNALMEVNILWGNMLVFMNESMSNWKNGQTYEHFVTNTDTFDAHMAELVSEKERGPRFRGKMFDHLENLHTVWKLAKVNVELIRTTRESPSFRRVEDLLTREPGLQRLYPAYMRMIFNPGSDDTPLSFALKEYIDAVEFFPIYGDTINYLFMIIFATMDQEYTRLRMIQNIVVGVFLIIFIMGIVYTTRHFTNSLASPIIKLSNKLNSFIGKSVESRLLVESDELVDLESSVDELIAHYTHLSKLAYRLSVGSIETSLLDLPRQGVVGNALKEVAAYLQELAATADWIREGKYGLQIQEKSDQDVLARSFNIMSMEIAEKLSKLTNMFETIEEGLLLVEQDGTILEANQHFLTLMGVSSLEELKECDIFSMIAGEDEELKSGIYCGVAVVDKHWIMRSCSGEQVPVKINIRPLTGLEEASNSVMMVISNESVRVRMRREKEKLEVQATEAELRALRAQINPHFFSTP